MISRFVFILLTFVSLLSRGFATSQIPLTLYSDDDLKVKFLFFVAADGSYLSDTPACHKSSCQAAKILTASSSMPRQAIDTGDGGKNPADLLCQKLKGENATFYNAEGDEVAVCVFPDGSRVLAWDLHRAHYHIKK